MATKNRTTHRPSKLERHAFYKSLESQGYQRPDTPFDIVVHSVRRRRIDVANTSDKAAIDGLVRGGVFEDDGPNQIASIKYTQEQGQDEKTIITFEVVK